MDLDFKNFKTGEYVTVTDDYIRLTRSAKRVYMVTARDNQGNYGVVDMARPDESTTFHHSWLRTLEREEAFKMGLAAGEEARQRVEEKKASRFNESNPEVGSW